jgi:transcriptional regulator with XRE-family HTH domain
VPEKPEPKYPKRTPSRIQQRRKELGLSPKDLNAVTGVSTRTISRAENGDPPTLRALVNIAIALEVDPLDLLQPEWLETWVPMHEYSTAKEPPPRGWWKAEPEAEGSGDRPTARRRRSRRKHSDWMGPSGGGGRQAPRHATD